MANKEKLNYKFMSTAYVFADMSHAIRKKVGAVVVKDGNIISIGWNGVPAGMDNSCEYLKDGVLVSKPEVIHAELNALMKLAKGTQSSDGAEIYVTLSPCVECSKLIIQSGIKKVYYSEEYRILDGIEFLKKSGIAVERIEGEY